MARHFDAASSQGLYVEETTISAAPYTISIWAKLDQLPSDYGSSYCVFYSSDGTTNQYVLIYVSSSNDKINLYSRSQTTGNGGAVITAAVTAGVWQHYCGVAVAVNDRAVFLNGGSKGTDANNSVPAGLSETSIGHNYTEGGNYTDGILASVTVWNTALTDAEVLELSESFSSKFIRPANIISRWTLHGNDKDEIGGHHLTPANGPTQVDGPRIIYPSIVF